MRNKFPYRLNRPNIRISAELPICGAEFLKNVKLQMSTYYAILVHVLVSYHT